MNTSTMDPQTNARGQTEIKNHTEPPDQATFFKDITPTWETVDFDEDIPAVLLRNAGDTTNTGADTDGTTTGTADTYVVNIPAGNNTAGNRITGNCIIGAVIGDLLVYRCFFVFKNITEQYRYVFHNNIVMKETRDRMWQMVSPESLLKDDAQDILGWAGAHYCEGLYEAFKEKVSMPGKPSIMLVMTHVKHDYPRLGFAPFLEIYIKSRKINPRPEGVPERILHELYGRNHSAYCSLRIARDLVVVTGEKSCRYITLKEQTRVYFDSVKAYYFVKNAVTGMWEQDEISKQFEFERDIKARLIDRNLLEGTVAQRYSDYAVTEHYAHNSRVNYGSLLAQMGFLAVEQAAKMRSPVYKVLLDEIYKGRFKDGEKSLPELLGITGPQLKFLNNIEIPHDLQEFKRLLGDPDFVKHFPDVKKRIFAVSFFLEYSHEYYYRNHAITEEELFMSAQTICSIERTDVEKRYHIAGEFADYIRMRRRFVYYRDTMQEDDPLRQEIIEFGEAPVNMKPSKVHDWHNRIGVIISIITRKKTIAECDRDIIKRKEQEAKEIEYTGERFSIIMPKDAKDIIREGRILHHCVGYGGYIEAMARRDCRILFLRDNSKPDEPLITIEERDGRIRQCYGFADSYNEDPDITSFIREYANEHGFEIATVI